MMEEKKLLLEAKVVTYEMDSCCMRWNMTGTNM